MKLLIPALFISLAIPLAKSLDRNQFVKIKISRKRYTQRFTCYLYSVARNIDAWKSDRFLIIIV